MTTQTIAGYVEDEKRGHERRLSVFEDRTFMAGVMEALEEESRGSQGKTLEEIRKEHGLTH